LKRYGIYKWRSRTPCDSEISDKDLVYLKREAIREYQAICKKYSRAFKRLNVLNSRAKRLKILRERLVTEFGERKAKACPCHVPTKLKIGNVLCLAKRRLWLNHYRGGEFYFWVCSSCRISRGYRETKALMRKLEGEYLKYVV